MLDSHVVQYRRVDWEITLDGETYSGSFNLHKPADLESVLTNVQSEIEDERETRGEE